MEWFEKREKDLGISRSMTSIAIGLEVYKTRRLLIGERAARPEEIASLAKVLKVPISEIIRRLGVPVHVPELLTVGKVRANGRIETLTKDERFLVPAPVEAVSDEWCAVVVDAPQSGISDFHGSIFYFQPSQVVRPDAFGRLSICEVGDAPAPIVGVVGRAGLGHGKIVVIGGAEEIETDMLLSATPVRWIRAG